MRRAIPAVLILAAVAALVLLFAPRSVDGPGPRGTADSVPVVAPPRNSVEPAAPRRRSGVLVLDAGGAPVDGAAVELSPLPVPGAGEPAPVPIGTADASGRVPWPERDLDFPVLVRAHHAKRGGGETLARRGDSDCVIRLLPPLTVRTFSVWYPPPPFFLELAIATMRSTAGACAANCPAFDVLTQSRSSTPLHQNRMSIAVSRITPGTGSLSTPESTEMTSTRCARKIGRYRSNGGFAKSRWSVRNTCAS